MEERKSLFSCLFNTRLYVFILQLALPVTGLA